jgi:hypothetical protein
VSCRSRQERALGYGDAIAAVTSSTARVSMSNVLVGVGGDEDARVGERERDDRR